MMERPAAMPMSVAPASTPTLSLTSSPTDVPADTPAASPAATAPAVTLSRQQILQATCVCLREHGYDATTIRRIAGSIGCAIGSIYRYYRDKRELLYEVTQQVLEPVARSLEQGADFATSVRQYAQVASREDEAYRLLFWLSCHVSDQGPADGVAPAALPSVVRRVVEGWAALLGDADLARRHWAMLHGCLMAGLDVEQSLSAMRNLRAGRREPMSEPQVVTTMKEPPLPRSMSTAESMSLSHAVAQTHAAAPASVEPRASTSGSTSPGGEDVCLL